MLRFLPLALVLLVGCGVTGRTIVSQGGTTLASVDAVVAPAYTQAAQDALEGAETKEEYQVAMEPWNAVEEAMRATKEALEVLESALEAGEPGVTILVRVRAVLAAAVHLADGLQLVGLEIPREVLEFLRQVRAFLGEPVGDDR